MKVEIFEDLSSAPSRYRVYESDNRLIAVVGNLHEARTIAKAIAKNNGEYLKFIEEVK